MYSPTPALGQRWREFFERLLAGAEALEWFDYPAPKPLSALWRATDNGAVFMCGLPFASGAYPVQALAAPIPTAGGALAMPQYCSEFVVAADSRFELLEDTFGERLALTDPESQSGFAAALEHLLAYSPRAPLYRELVGPQITPLANIVAVLEGLAEVAPVDSYALDLLRRFEPELTARLRSVARSRPTANPLLVASAGLKVGQVRSALLLAHTRPELKPLLAQLRLQGFAAVATAPYQALRQRFDEARSHWSKRALSQTVNPAFV